MDESLAICREEEIPEVGDHIRYDIAGRSFLIVRQSDGTAKCYPNACLHRGRMLKEFDGRASEPAALFMASLGSWAVV